MELKQGILTRRSVRSYKADPLTRQQLRDILYAGMCAPSARNAQPWEMLIVERREALDCLARVRPPWRHLTSAAAAVVLLANVVNTPDGAVDPGKPPADFFQQDCGACAQNMLLAAHGMGIGGVWLGLYPFKEPQQAVRELFGIPQQIIPYCVLSFGYPAQAEEKPPRPFREDKAFLGRYGQPFTL